MLLLTLLGLGGCASLPELIAEPRSESLLDARTRAELIDGLGLLPGELLTPDGVRIAYVEVPAIRRHYEYTLAVGADGAQFAFTTNRPAEGVAVPGRGSIVYLHGWGMEGSSLWPWALTFAEEGYRGYVLDLRNHGRSERAPAGFGPREATDVIALVDRLNGSGQLPEPVFLFGVSLGASSALFAEPALQGDLAGVIALEPFVNAADAIDSVLGSYLDAPPAGLQSRIQRAIVRWRYGHTGQARQTAIVDAGRKLDLDLAKVDLAPVAGQLQTCTLLLHGTEDAWLDPAASQALAARSPSIHFLPVSGTDHVTLPMRVDWLAPPMLEWLGAVADGTCESISLPPDPIKEQPVR